ncbi:MAG: GDSL-type esterase/lipase family protein [Lentisphaerota bacterium]
MQSVNSFKTRVCQFLAAAGIFTALSSGFAQDAAQDAAKDAGDWEWSKYGIVKTSNPAGIPAPRNEDWAVGCHKTNMAGKANLQVLFLGDSICHQFQHQGGAKVWSEFCAPLGAFAFAVPGDKTQNVLWRITAGGELDEINPKVLVILIGINNLYGTSDSAEDVAKGITAIVNYARTKLPDTKILLLGVFPCFSVDSPGTVKAQAANAIIAKLHDGKQVFFLDIGDRFIEPDKTISKEKLKDGLHPTEKGYRIWAESMRPYLDDLLNNNGSGDVWKNAGLKTIAAAGAKPEAKTDDKNLLKNGSLDQGDGAFIPGWIFSKWQLKEGSPESKAVEWGIVKEAGGNKCLKLATNGPAKTYIWFQQEIMCDPAQTYSLSFRSKANGTANYGCLFYLIDKDGHWIGTPENIAMELSGEWKTWTAKTTTPENAIKLGVRIGARFEDKAELFFDNIVLNKE